ncbi:MAG TPA: phosphate/phosphite/phosphonate ABC transporter substrate-binding protein [Gammaproteobacteria bacterium]|nr:phosphate/phosphite/phosphonate ABC transporter substrate-binding protein [Gammaproteobacteria bacterium]
MKYFFSLLVLLLAQSSAPADTVASTSKKTLILGIFPYLNARSVVSAYQPVREYLEHSLDQPVQIYTAPDFKIFAQRTRDGEYDIVVTPPHLARLAQSKSGYIPLLRYAPDITAVIVVAKDDPIRSPADLRNKIIAVPDELAMVTLASKTWLEKQGLRAERDYTFSAAKSHYDAIALVAHGKSSAAITSNRILNQLPNTLTRNVRVLISITIPTNVMYAANSRLPAVLVKKLSAVLLDFPNDAAGRSFLESNNYTGFKLITEMELQSLDSYVTDLELIMGTAP